MAVQAGRVPPAKRGRPYWDVREGRKMIVPREGGKAIPYVDGQRSRFEPKRALRRSGVTGRQLGGELLDTAGKAATSVADRGGTLGGAQIFPFVVAAAASVLGLILIDMLLSERGSTVVSLLFRSSGGALGRLLSPTDPIFGADARASQKAAVQNRKTPAASSSTGAATTTPAAAGPTVSVAGFVFPLAPTSAQRGKVSFSDGFADARPGGGGMNGGREHGAIDILAPEGTPVVAIADGTLANVGWNTYGGNRLHVVTAAGDFYYAHLQRYAPGITTGSKVRAGQVIGYVGKTGAAGGTPHLHFAFKPAGGGRYIDPFSMLRTLWDALTKPASRPSTSTLA